MTPECMHQFQVAKRLRSWGIWTLVAAGFRRIKFHNNHVIINHTRRSNIVDFLILTAIVRKGTYGV